MLILRGNSTHSNIYILLWNCSDICCPFFSIFQKPFEMHKGHGLTRSLLIRFTTQVYLNCYFVYMKTVILRIINKIMNNYFGFTWNLGNSSWFWKKEKKTMNSKHQFCFLINFYQNMLKKAYLKIVNFPFYCSTQY